MVIRITHPDKLLYPVDGITKGEVVAYYQLVGDKLLPHLRRRPLTLERFPNGISKPGFMQKNVAGYFPDFIGRHEVARREGGSTVHPIVEDLEGLLYLANQNTITFHVPSATIDLPHRPDRLIFDLDPPEGEVAAARAASSRVREMLSDLGLPALLKATGSKGYHVVVPIVPSLEFGPLDRVTQGLAWLVSARYPNRLTTEFLVRERAGRVFVDWLRNRPSATTVAPYSLRPRPGAPVAVPLAWEELQSVPPDGIGLRTIAGRMEVDPWASAQPADPTPLVEAVEGMLVEHGIELPGFDRFGRDTSGGGHDP